MTNPLLLLGGGGTSDNLDQLASNDGLTGSVEENLVLVDHVSCVLGGVLLKVSISVVRAKGRCAYIHGVTTSGDFTSMTFGKSPEESVRQSIFSEVTKDLVVNLEGGEVGYSSLVLALLDSHCLRTRVDDCLFGVSLNRGSLVTCGIN